MANVSCKSPGKKNRVGRCNAGKNKLDYFFPQEMCFNVSC